MVCVCVSPTCSTGLAVVPPCTIDFHQTLFRIRILRSSPRRSVKVKVETGVTSTGERALRSTDEGLYLQLS